MWMRILVIEDNDSFGQFMHESLSRIGDTSWLTSEREFRELFTVIEDAPPDVALIDIMLRWDYPRPDTVTAPPDFDLYDAGIRCARRLGNSGATRHVPVILYSVLPPSEVAELNLPTNVRFVRKTSDLHELIEAIHEATRSR